MPGLAWLATHGGARAFPWWASYALDAMIVAEAAMAFGMVAVFSRQFLESLSAR